MSDAWQPIETAPKDGTAILGYTTADIPCANNPPIALIRYFEDGFPRGWWGATGDSIILRHPTHWMPLPAAPEPLTYPCRGSPSA